MNNDRDRLKANQINKRFKGVPGHLDADDIREIREMSDGLCAYCLAVPAEDVEHCTPLTRGGYNLPSNIVMSCKRCNSMKSTSTPLEFCFAFGY
jgi:5-methylcytosine-specific restriction endonuclease McrA